MKLIFHFILLLISIEAFPQQDGVLESLDSLSNVYYFNKLELGDSTGNKYNYRAGFIPLCSDSEYSDRIELLNKNSPFKLVYNPIVKKYIRNYLKSAKSIALILANSKYYFPRYDDFFLKYSIPLELKYLSVIESALNPTAKSYCGAAGLWQFMPATGKAYGLHINSYVDERYNIDLSTDAACRYLKDLFNIYGDWALVIAAYNCGAGNVNRAIRYSGGKKDFFSIMEYLPKETQGYVPAYMAATYVLNYWEEHNVPRLKSKLNYADVDYVEINKTISLDKLSSMLQISPKEMRYLNPSYYIGIAPGNNDHITVPKEAALLFIEKEKSMRANAKPINTNPEKVNESISINTTVSKIVQKNIFGTIEITDRKNLKLTTVPESPKGEVVLCELINDYNSKSDEYVRVRNLKALENVPVNSILIGKIELLKGKEMIHFYSVANNKILINYYYEFVRVLKEGDTIYLRSSDLF